MSKAVCGKCKCNPCQCEEHEQLRQQFGELAERMICADGGVDALKRIEQLERELNEAKLHPYMGCFTGDCPHITRAECDKAIREYCASLEQRAEAAEADTKRLDWLETNHRELRWMPISKFWYLLTQGRKPFESEQFQADTIRQAIDAAMKGEQK